MIMHDNKVEHFSWRTVLYFMSTKYKSLTEELMKLHVPGVEWKILGGELY